MQKRERDNSVRRLAQVADPWLNRYVTCGHVGHKPEMPQRLGDSFLPHYLRR
jgi:hypothetical protein